MPISWRLVLFAPKADMDARRQRAVAVGRQIRNIGADSRGARGAWRERKSTGSGRGGRNKIAARQVEWACRILSDRIRLCFSWHLGTPFHAANSKCSQSD